MLVHIIFFLFKNTWAKIITFKSWWQKSKFGYSLWTKNSINPYFYYYMGSVL